MLQFCGAQIDKNQVFVGKNCGYARLSPHPLMAQLANFVEHNLGGLELICKNSET